MSYLCCVFNFHLFIVLNFIFYCLIIIMCLHICYVSHFVFLFHLLLLRSFVLMGPRPIFFLEPQRLIFNPSLGPTRAHSLAHDLPPKQANNRLNRTQSREAQKAYPLLASPAGLVQVQLLFPSPIHVQQTRCMVLFHAVSIRHAATAPCSLLTPCTNTITPR